MKIVATSDLHGFLPKTEKCGTVCICGDTVPLRIQKNFPESIKWLKEDFTEWCESLPCEKVILIAGNHDFVFQQLMENNEDPSYTQETLFPSSKIVYLRDNGFEYNGIKFWGTPWCPELKRWAFYRDSEGLLDAFNKIPEDIDVLLTHTPPKIDSVGTVLQYPDGPDFGCQELANVLQNRPNIKWVLSGHVHSGNHRPTECMNTRLVNVSYLDENYRDTYDPFEFTL